MVEKADRYEGRYELKGYTGEYVYASVRKPDMKDVSKDVIGSVIKGVASGVDGSVLTIS